MAVQYTFTHKRYKERHNETEKRHNMTLFVITAKLRVTQFQVIVITFHSIEGILSVYVSFNPLNPELNPICYLLALLGAHHFLHVSRLIRAVSFTSLLICFKILF